MQVNNLIETIRLAFFAIRIDLGVFAVHVGVAEKTIYNVFENRTSPTLPTFLSMLRVLEIQIQFHTDLDVGKAMQNLGFKPKNQEEMILGLWREFARLFFPENTPDQRICIEIGKKAKINTRTIKKYWELINYPTLDNLTAILAAVNVEIKLAMAADKLPTLLDKPTNLN